MCGIAGIFDLKGDRAPPADALARMSEAMARRGPDGAGAFDAPGVGLVHRRLAVIDVEGGTQPFHTEGGRGVLVFNGEIYNFRDLAGDLTAAGARLKTHSDTETLAEGLARHGADYVNRLRGMFAFAYYEPHAQRLTLARDRLGEKPLYYGTSPDGYFVFASDANAIAASRLLPLDLCPKATRDYFHLGYTPDPRSIFQSVHKLRAGTILTVHRGFKPALRTYWRPEFAPDPSITFEAAREGLLERLDEAVRLQMISDVPLGAFLSGGVDSSAIVASMAETGGDIVTCAVGFKEDSHDERPFARAVAAQYGTDHHEDVADPQALSLIDDVARAFGEPFADPSALPMFRVCALARKHVTVALSGDGGDEIFAGYRRYPFFVAEERIRSLAPLAVRRATFGALGAIYPKLDQAPRVLRLQTTLRALGASRAESYLASAGANLPSRMAGLLSPELRAAAPPSKALNVMRAAFARGRMLDPLSAAQAADLATWLPGRMLTKVDRAAMAHSLEVRAPFLDHKLVEWAGTLPPGFKLGPGPQGRFTGKRVLKSALEGRLGTDVLYRPKQGFGLPLAAWLRAPNGPLDRLDASDVWRNSGSLDVAAVASMQAAHRRGGEDFSQELWTVVMFDAFLRQLRRFRP